MAAEIAADGVLLPRGEIASSRSPWKGASTSCAR